MIPRKLRALAVPLAGGGRGVRLSADRYGVPGEPWQKHPAVQPEPDGGQSVQLQPGPAGHRPAAGSPAAVPGNTAVRSHLWVAALRTVTLYRPTLA